MNPKRKKVIESILELIKKKDLVVDNKLPTERNLAEMLGESRPIVREALIALEALGVLEIRDRQGIFLSSKEENEAKALLNIVGGWPADQVSRVMEMRQILDPSTAALSAIRRTNEQIEKMHSCLDEMRELVHESTPESARLGIHWNTILHMIIVNSTNNMSMVRIYEGLFSLTEGGLSMMRIETAPRDFGGRERVLSEHERLVAAIEKRDPDLAEQMAEIHLSHTVSAMDRLGQIMPSSNLYGKKLVGRLRFDKISGNLRK